MVASFLELLGPWAWVAFGLLILGIEIMMPSTILLWPGLSALVIGAITLLIGLDNPAWTWQIQLISFLILSLVAAYIGDRIMKKRKTEAADGPGLNERGRQLVGQIAVLQNPIVNGTGRVKFGDSSWRVTGPDAEAGTRIRVIGYNGSTLKVEKI